MNGETANKFISALVKALQTLCHGYVEFNDGIEIIGHIYLNIDSGASFDYVVKEKLCKNAENSTVFVSKSFQAQAPADECVSRKDRDEDEGPHFEDTSNMSPTAGTSRLQSAITSISNVLSGSQESQKPRHLEHTPHHPSLQNTGKRKRDHTSSYNSMQPPFKYTTLQTSSLPSSSYFGSGPSSKPAADRNHSEHFSNASHAEFFGGDSNQSSGMGADDEDDLRLDVTFVKEEYESQRNSSQRGVSANAPSRLSQDLSSSHSNMLHDGTAGSGSLAYSSSHHQGSQHFSSDATSDMRSINEDFQESSQVDVGQHAGQEPPNPRSNSSSLPGPQGLETVSSSQPPKPEGIAGISDTLKLGIKLFGPKFVADVASGKLSHSSSSPSELVTQNGTDVPESTNATVFPEMFDLTAVSDTSVKPGHKILWHDRKDKLKKTYLMRKEADLIKFCNKESGKETMSAESVSEQSLNSQLIEKLQGSENPLGHFGSPYRRKRGRPPKKLKILNDIHMSIGTDCRLENSTVEKDNCPNNVNSFGVQLFPDCAVPVAAFRNESFSRRTRGSYRQYTAADKLGIVNFGIKYGSTAASRKYSIPESTVRSWTKKMDTLIMQMKLSESASENKMLDVLIDKQELAVSLVIDKPGETPQHNMNTNSVAEIKIPSGDIKSTNGSP